MFMNLQQVIKRSGNATTAVVGAERNGPVIANIALLLALLIISQLNGVVLIA